MDFITDLVGHEPRERVKGSEAKVMFKESLDTVLSELIIFPDIVDDYYEECKNGEEPVLAAAMAVFIESSDNPEVLLYEISEYYSNLDGVIAEQEDDPKKRMHDYLKRVGYKIDRPEYAPWGKKSMQRQSTSEPKGMAGQRKKVAVPKWFKTWLYSPSVSQKTRKDIATKLKTASPAKAERIIKDLQKIATKSGVIKRKPEDDKEADEKDKRKKEVAGRLRKISDFSKEIAGHIRAAGKKPSVEQIEDYEKAVRTVNDIKDEATDAVDGLNVALKHFVNGAITAGELKNAASQARAPVTKLQRSASFLKRYATRREAKASPEIKDIIMRWAALADVGREAAKGKYTRITPLNMLADELRKAVDNWEDDKRDPNRAEDLWAVAGELDSMVRSIDDQVGKLVGTHNDKLKLAKPVGGESAKEATAKEQLKSKLLRGQEEMMSPEEQEEQLRRKLNELLYTKKMSFAEIAKLYDVKNIGTISKLTKDVGLRVPKGGEIGWRGKRAAAEPPLKTGYKEVGGELYGGVETERKDLWNKAVGEIAAGIGTDEEAILNAMSYLRQNNMPPSFENITTAFKSIGKDIPRDYAMKMLKAIPKRKLKKEDLEKRWFVAIPSGPLRRKTFAESLMLYDSDKIEEAYIITDALEELLRLTA